MIEPIASAAADAFDIRPDRWLENSFSSSHRRAHIQRADLGPISVMTFLAALLFRSRLSR